MTRIIDWDKVDNLFMAGCSITQCAASLGVSVDTLERKALSEKKARIADIQQEKRASGDSLLLGAQYHKAIKDKNPTMLIWLGKQRLQQKENLDAQINKDIEKKFDDKMSQVLALLGAPDECLEA
jgi:hypothetical protein